MAADRRVAADRRAIRARVVRIETYILAAADLPARLSIIPGGTVSRAAD